MICLLEFERPTESRKRERKYFGFSLEERNAVSYQIEKKGENWDSERRSREEVEEQ